MKISDSLKQGIIREMEPVISVLGLKNTNYIFNKIFSNGRKFPYFRDDVFRCLIDAFGNKNIKDLIYLDLGAGYGLSLLEGLLEGFDVYGIEPSPNSFQGRYAIALELMKENGIANPERRLFNCYGENMNNIPDNFADVVYSYQVLEHVQDIDRVLLETKRILKPKSIAYFTMPNYNSIYEGHYEILWIPYLLSKSKKLAKLYLKFINRNPSYVDWLNFTTPTYIRKKAEKVFKKDNIYLLPWGIRYLGILNKYIYAVGLLDFYIKLKIRGKDINQLKENKRMIFPFIKNNELFNNIWLLNLLLVITSIILFIFQPFVPDFRLIIINDD